MPTTEIPPRSPIPANPSVTPPGSDLYDAGSWESAYTEMHDVPALLIQLQDDLSRSRQREAFWISVVVHLAIIILAVNSTKFENLLHKRAVIMVSPEDLMRQKELTYLELPPDEQKLTQRPKSNVISDKDRMAQSKAPQLDRKELKKILDSARPGRPGASSPPAQSASAAGGSRSGGASSRNNPRRHRRRKTRRPACRLRPAERPSRLSAPAPCRRDRRSSRQPALP